MPRILENQGLTESIKFRKTSEVVKNINAGRTHKGEAELYGLWNSPGRMMKRPSTPRQSPAPLEIQTEYLSEFNAASLASRACLYHPYENKDSCPM